jgi:hypothetical protein
MGPGNPKNIAAKVEALQLSAEGLLKLLGSNDPAKRAQFIEIIKGVTTPAEFQLVESQLTAAQTLVTSVEASVKSMTQAAKQIGGAGAATAGH